VSRYRGFDPATRAAIVTRLLERDGPDCGLCLLPLDLAIVDPHHPAIISIDHVVALSAGGELGDVEHVDNLQLVHVRCNGLRTHFGDHPAAWFARELRKSVEAWPKPTKRERKAAKKSRKPEI
jgi:5-methylcytosine-specific restriction endonuclease McrA